jgi:hypothetical protein
VIGVSPINVSENANEPVEGQNIGPSHHRAVSGTACAFHQMIQVFKTGSPRSLARTTGS